METWVSGAAHRECVGKGDELPNRPTVSVVICAYTEDRWLQLKKSVASLARWGDRLRARGDEGPWFSCT